MRLPERLLKRLAPEAVGASQSTYKPDWLLRFEDMQHQYALYDEYYSGRVLKKPADPERPDDGLKFPLQLNITRTWTHMMSSYLWGDCQGSMVSFTVDRKKTDSGKVQKEEENRCAAMELALRELWVEQGNDTKADTASIDMMVFGGMVPKVAYDETDPFMPGLRTEWMPVTYFAPRWHPMDVNTLLESIIMFNMNRSDAGEIFGLDTSNLPDPVVYAEKWTRDTRTVMVHDREILVSNVNPLGFIPHIYVPRIRTPDNYGYFGLSLLTDVMGIQDEVNLRAADIGDGVGYSSHPIRWVVNYTGKDKLEVGADSLWDLGISLGGRTPAAGVLDTRTNYKEGMEFVKDIESFGRQASYLPPIAFGEDEGSQRSSLTLLVRYQPLTMEVERQRRFLGQGLREWAKKTLTLAARHGVKSGFNERDVLSHIITPHFSPVLPRSVEDLVNQWNIRIEGGFGTPEEAYEDLGHPEPKIAAERAAEYAEGVAKREQITKGVFNVDGKPAGGDRPGNAAVRGGGSQGDTSGGRKTASSSSS